ncbi:hypothetical protein [Calothrix sp. 336/3]|uniref:hypothetical protein n=1 Tax=Calothrix sp. 336/3 TaxID=1337936 RepID=UPI000AE25082|nr:hypothetical protein [Calothrix sp. 336/3]
MAIAQRNGVLSPSETEFYRSHGASAVVIELAIACFNYADNPGIYDSILVLGKIT